MIEKNYNPAEIEKEIYQSWEANGYFSPNANNETFSIALPPPNVTGSLHMGHAFQDTLMDILVRFHRMSGKSTLWQGGTDHAGIATQIVVERQLANQGLNRSDMKREDFIARVWDWKNESGGVITEQLRRMGASIDWGREKFTLDDELSKAVTKVFVDLYEEGLIYRGKRLVNWDPVLKTAVSDLEVVSEEENGHLWHFVYPIEGSDRHITVATTRPETMLGDTAVAVNPSDKRYESLVGQKVCLPLTGRLIPIIADDHVDQEFGSGCVKITPAHDFNDYKVGKEHGLAFINIFTETAEINSEAPTSFRGKERFEARKMVVSEMERLGLLEKIEPHKLMVPRGDRTRAIIEPFLTDQWFVRAEPLAKPAIEAVEGGQIHFIPKNWSKTYFEWMKNIEDWCISRQLWWGHRIPAWYDPEGQIHVGHSETDARQKSGLSSDIPLIQEEDVLDTWFSSALWPFSTLGWPEQTKELTKYYPTNVLVTGFDIIFFWVARMIMMGLKLTGNIPFHEVYIHGLVRDANGDKMSKSKGNILDPIDLIDGIALGPLIKKRTTGLIRPEDAPKIEADTKKQFPKGIPPFGTDALRFTFAIMATQGRDIRFDLSRIGGYRNFCNKIWNASRFVILSLSKDKEMPSTDELELDLADEWILSTFEQAAINSRANISKYRFDLAAKTLYEFVWDDYCDWYIEIAKKTLYDKHSAQKRISSVRYVLVSVLDASLRALHPFVPYITEKIWLELNKKLGTPKKTIMHASYPEPKSPDMMEYELSDFGWVKDLILAVRSTRSKYQIAPSARITIFATGENHKERKVLLSQKALIEHLAKIKLELGPTHSENNVTLLVGDTKIFVPMSDLIDPLEEKKRLEKERLRLLSDITKSESKLRNNNFVEKAPLEVVEEERKRLSLAEKSLSKIEEELVPSRTK